MSDVVSALFGALGVLIGFGWIALVLAVAGLLAFRGRRRALRRGTYPLRILPWYLGGPPGSSADPRDRR